MSKYAPRFASRQVALQALYAIDVAETRGEAAADDVFHEVARHFELPEAARAFAKELVCGVVERRAEIDALLSEASVRWRIDRMAAVDRNVLRIGTFELLASDTPASVAIDQAIELARRFGDDPSPAFVNGVLDGVARALAASRS